MIQNGSMALQSLNVIINVEKIHVIVRKDGRDKILAMLLYREEKSLIHKQIFHLWKNLLDGLHV